MKPYGRPSDELLLGLDGLDGLDAQAVCTNATLLAQNMVLFSSQRLSASVHLILCRICVGAGFPRQLPMSVQPGEEVLFLPFWPDYLASRGHSARIN